MNLARRADPQPECGRLGPTFQAYGPVAAPADWLVLPHDRSSDRRVASVTSLAHALVWSRPRQPVVSFPAPRGRTPEAPWNATRSDRAGWNDPACRLLGEAGDGVEVPVVVQDLQVPGAGGRRDDEVGDRSRSVLGLFGQCLLDLGGLFPDVFRSVDSAEGRFELLLHPGSFLDAPGGVKHLQFGDAQMLTSARIMRGSSSSRTAGRWSRASALLSARKRVTPHICSSAPGSRAAVQTRAAGTRKAGTMITKTCGRDSSHKSSRS